MNKIIKNDIENMIYEINGVEVMLDSDLASIYQVETKRINEAVKNNPDKFPERFSFILSDMESEKLLVEIFDHKNKIDTRGGRYKNPRIFTEQGIYMLATILKSKVATEVSVAIMDTFVKMRHYINYTKDILPYKYLVLESRVDKNTKRIDEIFDKFNPRNIVNDKVFFENEFYDAYSTLLSIFDSAKEEIIIIDNYASRELLDMLRNFNKNIIIVSKNIDDKLKLKYEKQYSNVTFNKCDCIHDRFIIIDKNVLYSCGSSLKDVGKKLFSIHRINSKKIILDILKSI